MVRKSRDAATRDNTKRVEAWKNPRLLPEPKEDAGYRYRWVRVGSAGTSDTANVSMRLREGYEPVKISEQPDMKIVPDVRARFPDMVEVGGLLLCKIPEELARAREESQERMTLAQIEAVDSHYMRESDPRMPLAAPQRKSEVSFGPRRTVKE